MNYDYASIEAKWHKYWEANNRIKISAPFLADGAGSVCRYAGSRGKHGGHSIVSRFSRKNTSRMPR